MKKVLKPNFGAGSKKSNGPRPVGEILQEYLEESNEPLAVAYRERRLNDLHPDTHLDVDLKVLTRLPGRMPVGEQLDGSLLRDGEYHFVFTEQHPEKTTERTIPRNVHTYVGRYINVNRRADNVVYPTFRYGLLFSQRISFEEFCCCAAKELLAVAGYVEKK